MQLQDFTVPTLNSDAQKTCEMQVTRCHDAERHSDTTRAIYTLQVGERKSRAASNYMNSIYVH
jgi:hypothetical protein